MCGITGIYSSKTLSENDINNGKQIVSQLVHRGPDNKQVFIDDNKKVFFGHNRLSIIYPSPLGNQPKTKGKYSIIFNGEIYNYKKLGSEYFEKKINEKFSDTEILLDSWIKWKKTFAEHIDGMYAFAIYDYTNLYLATDYFGEKPIYYFIEDSKFYFSSEIEPLLKILKDKTLNRNALDEFLTLGFLTDGQTPYLKIKKIKPNTIITINENLEIKEEKLINDIKIGDQKEIKENDEDDFANILIESIDSRMEADTDLSLLLSSGSDSSLIAAIISKELKKKISSVTLENPKFDESASSNSIANYLKIPNTIISQSKINEKIYINSSNTLNDNIESFAIDHLTKFLNKQGIKVALSGIGADEIFYGYNKYYISEKYNNLNLFNRFILKIKSNLKYLFYRDNFDPSKFINLKGYRKFIYLKNKISNDYFKDLNFDKNLQIDDHKFTFGCREFDINQTLAYSFLPSIDISSMTNSVELRSPYLNYKLLKFINKFDPKYIIGLPQKFFIKKLLSKYIPERLINKKKLGFRYDFVRSQNSRNFQFSKNHFPYFVKKIEPMLIKDNYEKILIRLIILEKFFKMNAK
jgi:asparagine synthase (glutamine-hydrolysing)